MADTPPYAAYLLPETVTPTDYALELYLDFEGSKFHGSEDVAIRVSPAAAIVSEDSSVNYSITLHALDLIISTNATLTIADTRLPCSRVVMDEERQEATLLFAAPAVRPHDSQNAILHVEFAGELVEALAGLYKSPYKRADGTSAWAAVTQFQATDARRCFPCWDEPDKKAVFRLKVNTPAHMTAISNNVVENVAVVSEGARKVWTFAPSPKMSSYLV
jgi:puromycin-sensitive aminopeptidase